MSDTLAENLRADAPDGWAVESTPHYCKLVRERDRRLSPSGVLATDRIVILVKADRIGLVRGYKSGDRARITETPTADACRLARHIDAECDDAACQYVDVQDVLRVESEQATLGDTNV